MNAMIKLLFNSGGLISLIMMTTLQVVEVRDSPARPATSQSAHEEARREYDELRETLQHARTRIAGVRRPCALTVAWREYTSRFENILAGVGDVPTLPAFRERAHAMFGLHDLDMFISRAERYDDEVCEDDRELETLERADERRRRLALESLRRVVDAVPWNRKSACRNMTSDRARMTSIIHDHQPTDEQALWTYDEVSKKFLDGVSRLSRGGTLCTTRKQRPVSLLGGAGGRGLASLP